jgi:zinc D-Ala-D-Ala carboxypeptidase
MLSYFTDEELRCKCCGKLEMDDVFRDRLSWVRETAGFPLLIDSGYRCPKHNAEVGSTSTNHTKGLAVDVLNLDHNLRYRIIAAAIRSGILGIGIGNNYLHLDTNRIIPSIWTAGYD